MVAIYSVAKSSLYSAVGVALFEGRNISGQLSSSSGLLPVVSDILMNLLALGLAQRRVGQGCAMECLRSHALSDDG